MSESKERKVVIIETVGKLNRDRTSYGYQWFVDGLEIDFISPQFEYKKVNIRIEIEEEDNES